MAGRFKEVGGQHVRALLVAGVIAVAPTFGCFAYYRQSDSGATGFGAVLMASILPTILLSLIALLVLHESRANWRWQRRLALACFVIASVCLFWIA